MAETESDIPKMKPKPRPRPIVRLGLFLMSHSLLASVVCCSAGVLALLLLPVLAKNTYISENALMPGSANPMLSNQDIVLANKLAEDIYDLDFKSADTAGIQSRSLIAQYVSNLGAEASYHKFHPPMNRFNPLLFFGSPDSGMIEGSTNCSIHGVNMVGIIRAPRGDGKEAIVLVTPYNFGRSSLGETLSLSIAFSVFSLLTRVTWLSKDIIWLVADSQFGEYPPVAAWLRDYHTPAFSSFGTLGAEMSRKTYNINELEQDSIEERDLTDGLKRAGTMAAALVIKVADKNEPFEDSLGMYVEASNGQMPNLDLINIVNYLAVHRQGLHVNVEKFWSLLGSKWLKILGEVFKSLGDLAKCLNPQWKFGIPAADYIEGTATLVSSLYYQALGIPTGPHGAFRDFQVDAITLEISPRVSSTNKGRRNEFLLRGGRLIEGVTRSVNNLLEKFHQSFFLYLLTSPSKFVSVGVYMIPFALLVAPLPLVAASLYADADRKNLSPQNGKSTSSTTVAADDEIGITFRSWKWLNAARKVFVVHVWGAIVSLLPYFISRIPDCSPDYSFGIWMIFSVLILLILYFILGFQLPLAQLSQCENGEWAILKSVTTSAVFIGLCLMSVINFATAEIGALLMVPTCLLACPLKLDIKACNLKSVARVITNLVLVTLSFPPAAFFVLKGEVEGLSGSNVGDFWIWVESLWAWNSATYLYIGMIHLPCWVLCLDVLLHSC